MKQVGLKLKSYAGSVNIIDNNNLPRRILNIFVVSGGALALLYVLLLGSMVVNIVERKSLETNARTLGNEVAELELEYLSVSNKIDANLGYSLGFKEREAKFATRKSLGSLGSAENIKLSKNDI